MSTTCGECGTLLFNSNDDGGDQDHVSRDIGYLFKFKVGDRVKKMWRWNKNHYGRYDTNDLKPCCPIGTIVTIKAILNDGTLCCQWPHPKTTNPCAWHFGASEMDVVESESSEMIEI